jgi:hypothetical protein
MGDWCGLHQSGTVLLCPRTGVRNRKCLCCAKRKNQRSMREMLTERWRLLDTSLLMGAPHCHHLRRDQAHSRLTAAIWTPPVVQDQWTQSPARVGLHVYIRPVSRRCYSSPDECAHTAPIRSAVSCSTCEVIGVAVRRSDRLAITPCFLAASGEPSHLVLTLRLRSAAPA